jgi:hypothetical protein
VEDPEKYALEQAKIEIDQNRSWPTKILAFYVAINFGLVTSLLSDKTPSVPVCWRLILIGIVIFISGWVIALMRKNHLNYLRYRNIQVAYQTAHLESLREKLPLPEEWFLRNEICACTRFFGWGFYAFLVVFIMLLSVAGIWVS